MKLVRNAVYALAHESIGETYAFLHVNRNDEINPFWLSEYGKNGFSLHGELCGLPAGDHEHWSGAADESDVVMVQSHVTKASDVDFKRCMKFAKMSKRK